MTQGRPITANTFAGEWARVTDTSHKEGTHVEKIWLAMGRALRVGATALLALTTLTQGGGKKPAI